MLKILRSIAMPALLLAIGTGSATAVAQSAPPGLPPGVYMGEADYKQATAGTYTLDPEHASVIARVSHLRYSYSIFRFDRLSATLTWDPANVANSALTAKVETASITSYSVSTECLSGKSTNPMQLVAIV